MSLHTESTVSQCVQCSAAESDLWQPAEDGRDGQICFNCFEAATNDGNDVSLLPIAAAASSAASSPPSLRLSKTDNMDIDSTNSTEPPNREEAAPSPLSLTSDERQKSQQQQQRLRKSTRSTRYKAKPPNSSNVISQSSQSMTSNLSASASSAFAAVAEDLLAISAGLAAVVDYEDSISGTKCDNLSTADGQYVAAAGTAAAASSASTSSCTSSSAHHSTVVSKATLASGTALVQTSTASSGNCTSMGGGKTPAPRGRSRRGALFKRNPPSRTPTATATTRCVSYCFQNGSYMQIGDIVSLLGADDGACYFAQIRGLLVDSNCEKSAFLTWLLPTLASPPPSERFEPSTYVIGPDEEQARRLDCLAFVMHAPSGYYRSRTEPYPAVLPDGSYGGNDDERSGGFIWTSLAEAKAPKRADVTKGTTATTKTASLKASRVFAI